MTIMQGKLCSEI